MFPGHRFSKDLAALILAKTEGSPLFMADLVRYLRDGGVIRAEPDGWVLAQAMPDLERVLPESVRGMIERKIGQLTDEDRGRWWLQRARLRIRLRGRRRRRL